MIILTEGPDGQGKTTLCREFIKLSGGGSYTHLTYRWKNIMHSYQFIGLRHTISKAKKFPIATLDRCWLSEDIYARVYRSGSSVPMSGRILQKWIEMNSVQTIVCCSDPKVAADRNAKLSSERQEMYNTGMDKIAEMYNTAYSGNYNWQVQNTYLDLIIANGGLKQSKDVHYYTIGDSIKDLYDRVRCRYEQKSKGAIVHYSFGGNSNYAKFILVGDKVNYKNPSKVGPFMGHSHSSLFLARSIHALGILESDICYYNVNDAPEIAGQVIERFGDRVIVLGRSAQKTLMSVNAKYGRFACINHPSFVCRWLGTQGLSDSARQEYSIKLAQAIDASNIDVPTNH